MSKKKWVLLIGILAIVLNALIIAIPIGYEPASIQFTYHVNADVSGELQIYYSSDEIFSEEKSEKIEYRKKDGSSSVTGSVDSDANYIRMDFDKGQKEILVDQLCLQYRKKQLPLNMELLYRGKTNEVSLQKQGDQIKILIQGEDPFVVLDIRDYGQKELVYGYQKQMGFVKKVICFILIDMFLLVLFKFREKASVLPIELYRNRKLILKLGKNDFKTKYAGSYLGIFWAFVQPVVTVLVYWFVFQVGFRSMPVGNTPWVLYLVSGLVPWFFFSDAINGGTNALIEYNYLVKKVVFKISILPIIKIISAAFVHLFFLIFTVVLFSCYERFPDLYTLQIFYYSFCVFILVLGICYATCSIVVFFRDLTQIINIFLQVGVWLTPIMWQLDMVGKLAWIFKLNPLYYIVNGYRDALVNKVWFWQHSFMTIYFWMFAMVLFGVGAMIFKKLKIHFADVL